MIQNPVMCVSGTKSNKTNLLNFLFSIEGGKERKWEKKFKYQIWPIKNLVGLKGLCPPFHMRQRTCILSFSNYFFEGIFSTSQLLWIFQHSQRFQALWFWVFPCVGTNAFEVFQTCFLWIFPHFSNIYCLDFSNILEGLELYSF